MGGIYIHIPFCRKACVYCNFHFSTSLRKKSELVKCITEEAIARKSFFQERVQTVYFGGGTPGLLDKDDLTLIMQCLHMHFDIDKAAEITLEANPDDVSSEKTADWLEAGINRISIGVQSFHEKALQWMNRSHLAKLSNDSIQLLQKAGFSNINADLIFGIPVLDEFGFEEDLEQMLSFDLPHISAYALTVEPKTPLDKLIRLKQSPNTEDDVQMRQFTHLMHRLEDAGYEQYEISNFAKPGGRSRHNSSYWTGEKYLGLGPSAHSFDGNNIRSFNIANNDAYIREIQQGKLPAEQEILTPPQQINEMIMMALRRKEGLDLLLLQQKFGNEKRDFLEENCRTYLKSGEMKKEDNHLILTLSGKLRADGIAADLFFES